jgi:hypothetical protein
LQNKVSGKYNANAEAAAANALDKGRRQLVDELK